MRGHPRSSPFSESAPEMRRRQPSPVTKNCGGSSLSQSAVVDLSLISCRDINGRGSTTSDGDGTSSTSPSVPRPRSIKPCRPSPPCLLPNRKRTIVLIEDPYIVNPPESVPSKRKRSNWISAFGFRRDHTSSIGSSSSLEDKKLVGWLKAMATWEAKIEANSEAYIQWKIEFLAIGNHISEDFVKSILLVSGERELLQRFLNLPNHLNGLVGEKITSIVQLAAGRKASTEDGNKINKAGRDVFHALHRALLFLQQALTYEATSLDALREESRQLGIKVKKMRGLIVSMKQDLTANMSMRIREVWSELSEALTTTTYNTLGLEVFKVFALHLVCVSSLQGATGKLVSYAKEWRTNPVTERFQNLVELICEREEKKGKCYYVRLFSEFLEPVKYTHPANIKELLLDLSYNEKIGNLFTHFSVLIKNLIALHSHLEEAPVYNTRNLISEYYKLLWELKQPILGQQLDPSMKEQLEKMWGAKSSILVVGSASTLRKDIHWNNLVGNAEKRQCLVKVSKPYAAFFSDDSLESMRTKEEVSPNMEVQIDELDYSIHSYNVGDAGEAQGDDNVYGGDDMDMDDGGFGDD